MNGQTVIQNINLVSIIIGIVIALIIVAIVLLIYKAKNKNQNNTKRNIKSSPEKAGGKDPAQDDQFERFKAVSWRIKPHFINNILSSIYYLCDMDPKAAQGVVSEMSGYMLGSLNMLESGKPVPFESELGMINNYISLEKLRFEDKLKVSYDVAVTDFKIPPLTVLPLVENAVKHGIAESKEAGLVSVKTRRLADGNIQISVTDDGAGFDTSVLKDGEKELAHIKERIQRQPGGSLVIESTPGEGTSAVITLTPEA